MTARNDEVHLSKSIFCLSILVTTLYCISCSFLGWHYSYATLYIWFICCAVGLLPYLSISLSLSSSNAVSVCHSFDIDFEDNRSKRVSYPFLPVSLSHCLTLCLSPSISLLYSSFKIRIYCIAKKKGNTCAMLTPHPLFHSALPGLFPWAWRYLTTRYLHYTYATLPLPRPSPLAASRSHSRQCLFDYFGKFILRHLSLKVTSKIPKYTGDDIENYRRACDDKVEEEEEVGDEGGGGDEQEEAEAETLTMLYNMTHTYLLLLLFWNRIQRVSQSKWKQLVFLVFLLLL